jgi:hypothetical protein
MDDRARERILELMERIGYLREHEPFEGFPYQGQLWNVLKARGLVADRKPDVLVIDEALRTAAETPSMNAAWATAPPELSDPVIVIPLPAEIFGPGPGDLVIDDGLRLWRALTDGTGELPAHFLTPEEEREIRESDAWESPDPHFPWHAQRREV